MKMPRISRTGLGSLLSRLRDAGEVKNPNEAKQRALFLEKARQLRIERERQEEMNKSLSSRRAVVSFGPIMASLSFRTLVQQRPVQEMATTEYRGHHVMITRAGRSYSVRLDRNTLTDRHDLTMNEAIAYVESRTWEGGDEWDS